MKKILSLAGKIALRGFLGLVALVFFVWGGLNLAKFAIYSDYFSLKTNVCKNPGLNDGFVCQGICSLEEKGLFLVSGYMKDDSPSRIYITDTADQSRFVTLHKDGEPVNGHLGGISRFGDRIYVADDGAVYLFSVYALLSAKPGSAVSCEERVEVNNSASFCFADEEYLYVGEFHNGEKYVTNHPHAAPEGQNYAIVSLYSHQDLTQPVRIYSIRNKVQGLAVKNGKMLFSTSYGLTDSEYFLYDLATATDSGKTLDGAPLYHFSSFERTLKGPAMAEGITLWKGKFTTLTESASDKYVFGKFFFATKIVALDL